MSRTSEKFDDYQHFADLQLFGLDILFIDLNNYQNLIESFLLTEKKKLEEEFNKTDLELESKKAGDQHREYYNHLVDSYAERHHDIAGLFPHHFRCFFLTQTISVIEAELKKICNYHGTLTNQKFSVDDIKGSSDLERCKFYITNISNVNFSDLSPQWNFIQNCKSLRNKIVHEEARIKMDNKGLLSFIKSHPSLAHDEYSENTTRIGFTIENNALAIELIQKGKEFLSLLLEKLNNDRYER